MMRKALSLALLLAALAVPVHAQFIGYTAAQSTVQTLFLNHAGPGTSVTITNKGQSSHFLTICNSTFIGTVILEASRDGTFNPPTTVAAANYALFPGFSGVGVSDSNCHLMQAGGYYATLRVRITNTLVPVNPASTTTIFYSGIGGPVAPTPPALSTKGPTSPIACEDTRTISVIPGGSGSALVVQANPGTTIIVCSVTISFDATTTAGALSFGEDLTGGGACTAPLNQVFQVAITPATPQVLHLPGGLGGLFRLDHGASLCFAPGSIGANTFLELSFAQITF